MQFNEAIYGITKSTSTPTRYNNLSNGCSICVCLALETLFDFDNVARSWIQGYQT